MCNKTIWNFIFLFAITPLVNLQGQQLEKNQKDKAISYLIKQGLSPSDFGEMKISDQYYSTSLDMHHTYFQQYYMDIPVENAVLNVGFKNGKLVNSNHSFAMNISANPYILNSIIPAERGLVLALRKIGKGYTSFPELKSTKKNSRGVSSSLTFDKGSVSKRDIEVSLIWVKDNNSIKLCWQSNIEVEDSNNEWYLIQMDALTGEYVNRRNLIIECNFEKCPDEQQTERSSNSSRNTIHSLANSYTVFDLPVESPAHGSQSTTSIPWDRAGTGNDATTLGWHNDGTSSYTITRGNNVNAYEDQAGNNSIGYSPDGGAGLDFNFTFVPTNTPQQNIDASITNLFHTCNLIHDIVYQYGFDESAGNFQADNQARGGTGGDQVLAEALDGSGTDNANFSTVPEGTSGRMQMFLWNSTPPPDLVVNTPMTITSPIFSQESGFSTANKLIAVGPVTGDIKIADDGTAIPSEACNALINGGVISGNIALIDRGNCDFTVKVKNAQNAGAIAAIVVNNNPGENPIPMGGDDNTITIPAVMVSYEIGQEIRTALMTETVNVTMTGYAPTVLDGSYDNGIVIHEYGHGISTRLTGGPASHLCLQNDEQMGEGWSDFFALMLTTDWSTVLESDPRGIGTYAIGEPPEGTGIRSFPYSTDLGINPFTYGDLPSAPLDQMGNVIPHFGGSIWGTMLWDLVWNIIDITPIDTDIYHGTGGNNIAMQLVMDGLKLQPCSPGFVDGRDAILLADEINYGGKYKCAIWEAFARRGLGLSADQVSSASHTDGVEAFDIPGGVEIKQSISNPTAIEGEVVTVVTEGICLCQTENSYQVKHELSIGYSLLSINEGSQSGNQVVSMVKNLSPRDTVRLSFDVRIDLCSAQDSSVLLNDNVEGTSQFNNAKTQGKQWLTNSSISNSSSNSWYAENFSTGSDIKLTMINNVAISGATFLTFYHRFNTEATWDGGVVEISTDNGSTWNDLGNNFIENGYPSTFASNGSSNLAGRDGFTGSSDAIYGTTSFVKSVVDLFPYDGQNIKIRFRSATDGNTVGGGINGWYIDDVNITSFTGLFTEGYTFQGINVKDSITSFIQVDSFIGNSIYVDETTTGSRYGGDWSNAYLSLQNALKTSGCNNIDTIYLAAGSYLPFNQRDTSFTLTSDIVILGGFPAGGGTRNPLSHFSILSGDIGTSSDDSDNTYHVVLSGAGVTNAVLDGVIIEKGHANGGGDDDEGSGIFNLGNITLRDVTIRNSQGSSKVHNKASGNVTMKGKTILEKLISY